MIPVVGKRHDGGLAGRHYAGILAIGRGILGHRGFGRCLLGCCGVSRLVLRHRGLAGTGIVEAKHLGAGKHNCTSNKQARRNSHARQNAHALRRETQDFAWRLLGGGVNECLLVGRAAGHFLGKHIVASFGFRHRIRSHVGRHIDLPSYYRRTLRHIAFLHQLRLAVVFACIRSFVNGARRLVTPRFNYEAVVDVTQRRKQAK